MLTPVVNKEAEHKPSRLEKAAQLFGMTTSLANAAGSAYGMFGPSTSSVPGVSSSGLEGGSYDDTWAKLLTKLRLTNKGI